MNKQEVIAFFDRCAPSWDADMVRNEEAISTILDCGGIHAGVTVLDVACGTGVLIPDYLSRQVSSVTAVDISPEMVRIAKSKFHQPNVMILCDDIETIRLSDAFDCCMVYNAFPHFQDPVVLLAALAGHLRRGGRLTVAHSMSREAIDRHHSGAACRVSRGLLHEDELAALFSTRFDVDIKISDDEKYIVSGTLR